ncbi:hypothetical protein [Clostridium cellulovorans]|uniref:hypothetical protein n=1 Tax=Clostridium cellulovorans TaxID=1493 RepID=UPI0001A96B06|nr:hypothetical protein [Clostridium cellulovorans]
MMEIKWKLVLRFKEGSVAREFDILKALDGDANKNCKLINEIGYNHRILNDIEAEMDDDAKNKRAE